jgi:type IV fimbrial biogenesis protein FimT
MYSKLSIGLQKLRVARTALPPMAGVTLIELLTVISIVAILMVIGVPSYKYITTSYRISGEVNGLLGDMQFARAEAVKEGQVVTICVSTDGLTCGGGAAWQSGWIVFPGSAATGASNAASVLRVQAAFTGSDTFTDGTYATSAVTFDREGLVNSLNSGHGALIAVHDPTANLTWTRCLQITSVGAMQVTQHSNNAGCT